MVFLPFIIDKKYNKTYNYYELQKKIWRMYEKR